MDIFFQFVKAFLVGGTICMLGQLLILKTKLTSARILVLFVSLGAVLTALGLYGPLVEFAGAGATVPLLGFGYTLAQGAIDAVHESGILGAFSGGVASASTGITAAILFGYLFAVLFTPKTKS